MARIAIVTGSDSDSGIGKATAVALAQAGCDVGVTWHDDEQGAQETAEERAARGPPHARAGPLLTKVMALELGAHGITVNAVAPGEIATR